MAMVDQRLLSEFQAMPVHSPAQHSRLSLDPRLARQLARQSSVPAETRAALSQYVVTSKWTPPERAIYSAVVEGFTSEGELETVTGMTPAKVKTTVGKLEKRGVLRRITSG